MCEIYTFIKGAGILLLFDFYFEKTRAKSFCFIPSPQIQKPCTIKNALRFELHFRLCFGKADGAEKPRLERRGGFGGICWFASASQAGLAERGESELLSFVLSFQKRKYIKKGVCRFRKEENAVRSAPSVTTSSCQLPQRGSLKNPSRRSLLGLLRTLANLHPKWEAKTLALSLNRRRKSSRVYYTSV